MSDYVERPEPLRGYRELTAREKAVVDRIKVMELEVAQLWAAVDREPDSDSAYLRVAHEQFVSAFMWLVRSVTRPRDVFREQFANNQQDQAEGVISAKVDGGGALR